MSGYIGNTSVEEYAGTGYSPPVPLRANTAVGLLENYYYTLCRGSTAKPRSGGATRTPLARAVESSARDDEVPFVEGRQQNRVEVNRPDPVVGLFQADVLVDHRIRKVQQAVLEPERAAGGDLLDEIVPGVLERR